MNVDRRSLQRALLCFFSALIVFSAAAQDRPGAVRPLSYQVGAGFSFAKTDYDFDYIKGITLYANLDFRHRVGIEADVHYTNVWTPQDSGEYIFLAGPRVVLLRSSFAGRRDFFQPYAKLLGGIGVFQVDKGFYDANHSDTYGVLAVGGGVDLHVSQHINVRAIDVEWEKWPSFEPNGLNPKVITMGAAYRF